MTISRFHGLSALVLAALATGAQSAPLDPAKPQDAVEISKRVQCGDADAKPSIFHWTGKVYSRVQGEPDRLLFTGEGMNIRHCAAVTDPVRGKGFRLVSREIMLFTDPTTGEVLRQWTNPWTGETVDVLQIANDPVNQPPIFEKTRDGKPYSITYRQIGPWFLMPLEIPLFYTNPLAGPYQDHIGGKYHAMEIFDFAAPSADLLDSKRRVSPSISWVRISDWMPWMKMRGRQGQLVFNAMGGRVDSLDQLPAVLRTEINERYPTYRTAPPIDDKRPNETTWTVFKKHMESTAKPAPTAASGGHH